MKKKRVLNLMAALLMTVSVIGGTTLQASAEGCGNWEAYLTGTPYCIDEGCGFLWLNPQTHYQRMYYKRSCVSGDNKVTTEYMSSLEKLGCC